MTFLRRKTCLVLVTIAVGSLGNILAARATEPLAPSQSIPAPSEQKQLGGASRAACAPFIDQIDADGSSSQPLEAAEMVSACNVNHTDLRPPLGQIETGSASPVDKGRTANRPFGLKATLYITTDRDSGHDSIGCNVIPMRTVAVDGRVVKRHSVLFIKETVGLRMPNGQVHDGYWYATDVGSAIRQGRIDLYTGKGFATIKPLLHLNLKTLTVTQVGHFAGCPSRSGVQMVSENS